MSKEEYGGEALQYNNERWRRFWTLTRKLASSSDGSTKYSGVQPDTRLSIHAQSARASSNQGTRLTYNISLPRATETSWNSHKYKCVILSSGIFNDGTTPGSRITEVP